MEQNLKQSLTKKWAEKKTSNKPVTTEPQNAPFRDPRDPLVFYIARKKAGSNYEWEYVHLEKEKWVVGKQLMAYSDFEHLLPQMPRSHWAIYVEHMLCDMPNDKINDMLDDMLSDKSKTNPPATKR